MIPISQEERALLSRMYRDYVLTDPRKNKFARIIKGYLLTSRVQESIDMAIEDQHERERQDESDEEIQGEEEIRREYKYVAKIRPVIGFCYECFRRYYGCSVHRRGFRKFRRGFSIVKNN